MKASALRGLILTAILALVTAGPQASAAPPKTLAKVRHPDGTPHKASSFAPHPTRSRVFGAPIQPPILHSAPPKPPTPK